MFITIIMNEVLGLEEGFKTLSVTCPLTLFHTFPNQLNYFPLSFFPPKELLGQTPWSVRAKNNLKKRVTMNYLILDSTIMECEGIFFLEVWVSP